MLEQIKWFLKIGWKFLRYENGEDFGDMVAVYEHKNTGEIRRVLL